MNCYANYSAKTPRRRHVHPLIAAIPRVRKTIEIIVFKRDRVFEKDYGWKSIDNAIKQSRIKRGTKADEIMRNIYAETSSPANVIILDLIRGRVLWPYMTFEVDTRLRVQVRVRGG